MQSINHPISIAFIGSKGGVGQTTFLLNFAYSLMGLKKDILYFDASHNLFELENLLNINFNKYLTKENIDSVSINNVIKGVFEKFDVLASNLDKDFNNELTLYEQYSFIELISSINKRYDYFLIDISSSLKKIIISLRVLQI